jgi:hypothetical protein
MPTPKILLVSSVSRGGRVVLGIDNIIINTDGDVVIVCTSWKRDLIHQWTPEAKMRQSSSGTPQRR